LPSVKKTLSKEAICRVSKKTLSKELFAECQKDNTRQRSFFAECKKKHSAKSLPSVFFRALGKALIYRVPEKNTRQTT